MSEAHLFPNGWFAVAFTHELSPGSAIPRRAFGQELVVWRTEDGKVVIHNAHCPHLGAHLGHGGKVTGDSISCPFHGWRFNEDGQCVDVPYERLKPKAKLQSWPVCEQNGVVYIWHDREGRAPSWSMPLLAEVSPAKDETQEWTIRGCVEDICENGVDYAHFKWVHGSNIVEASGPIKVDGPALTVEVVPRQDLRDDDLPSVTLKNAVIGPGLVFAEVDHNGVKQRARLYSTPVDEEHITLRGMVAATAEGHPDPASFTKMMSELVMEQWEQDIIIWENKIRQLRPMLTASEGSIAQYRNWYAQFYN